ncbi:uncharacterized protein LOC113316883 [Papaver somniferum]|uniref:uncharacterized protein LOC113316883 n=1 Tax=Papaver somniferum TaxID=3469 RepID=UPI000E6FCF90|nr:uncharacterized protein LOC113316883 [Papaver somniferum]
MDHLFEIDNTKTEKINAMRKFKRIKNIANLFRLVEIFLVFMFISWVSTNHLSNLLKCFGEHLHNLSVFVAKPKFVFIVGNAIILTLFAKSGNNSYSSSSSSSFSNGFSETIHHDLYDDFIKNSNRNRAGSKTEVKEEEIVFQDKETVIEEEFNDVLVSKPVSTAINGDVDLMDSNNRGYRRSKSENLKNHGVYEKQSLPKVGRSETEKYRNVEKKKVSRCEDVEMMSNDELRKKVEDFIAKQMRFHREESTTIVLPKTKNGY